MWLLQCIPLIPLLLSSIVFALVYDTEQVAFNLNTNQTATNPLDYWGEWQNHVFNPSPSNWRMPFYTIMLDRFVNGNPSNDDANGTQYEHDLTQTQLRHGGDIKGLRDSLDYVQGMGIKVLYLAGSPHINVPWASDGYSPLDLTLLDHHFGTIAEWQEAIAEVHRRGMYVVLDNTMSTMGDLIGFEGFLNTSTPFNNKEHNALWKSDRRYLDFSFGNDELPQCEYPRFYDDSGLEVTNETSVLVGCRDSEFDQYGEIAAFGNYPEWQRQISKFAFVQDRLREWRPDVLAKIERFACITLAMLDIDGYRMDKGLMITVDAQAHWSDSIRQCARKFGKENFYVSGEIVAGNTFGSVYIGRGRSPANYVSNVTEAVQLTNKSGDKYFIRDNGLSAFDGAAFHYTVYRFLTRFLGMDGTFGAEGDPPTDWVDFWTTIIQTNDMINANNGQWDPRHMYGVTNQDVFRWPTITNGTEKQLLGYFIVTLLLPGIPTLAWGEEQAFYVLDNTASNYVFGRSPMTSSQAWGMHGCYKVGNVKYFNWPLESGIYGCEDETINLDHRDPSHPVRNIYKSMHEMRANYPILNDGFSLNQLSKQTHNTLLPGSNGTATEIGIWSIERASFAAVQSINQTAWLVYTNENAMTTFTFDCAANDSALIAPFPASTVVKNIYFPYDEYTLEVGPAKRQDDLKNFVGCLPNFTLPAWGYKAFVPKDEFIPPSPVITKFSPGHDARIASTQSIIIEFHFSQPMNCQQIKDTLQINSTTANSQNAKLDPNSVQCNNVSSAEEDGSLWSGQANTTWSFVGALDNVADGVHQITLNNITTSNGNASTNSVDHFLLRVGASTNPIVFPGSANYSSSLLFTNPDKSLYISHKASGADMFRYSLNFGTTYSDWLPYSSGANATLAPRVWSGTQAQDWEGDHVIVQYWSQLAGSSDHVQHGDVNFNQPRRLPHVFLQGVFNQYGFDAGFANTMKMGLDSIWRFNFMTEWPAQTALNVWGINPDGQPDQTGVYGDIDGDSVLDRIPPLSLIQNLINITDGPPSPYLSWQIALDDANLRYQLNPVGNRWVQLVLYILLWIIPAITSVAGVVTFMKSFYSVKFNKIGVPTKRSKNIFSLALRRKGKNKNLPTQWSNSNPYGQVSTEPSNLTLTGPLPDGIVSPGVNTPADVLAAKRRTVLIATMEYDIEDWAIKIKIGGLGVMAQLMGKNLEHQDLIWVVPCVGGIDYPVDAPGESIVIQVLGNLYEVKTQYHVLRNITYVLLDAPIFRQQTKSEPYPPRMDDLDSAVYYSAWNSCIAEVMRRFPIDLYHINDYHGAVAPLHLLPKVVPCVLSLHNAEFQGLWPMRNALETQEVCEVYSLPPEIVQKYVQFGEVFNLLHAGASYLRVHQKGFGAVGVSAKYGKRSFARYPILWGMKEVGALPNPDPTDTGPWNKEQVKTEDIFVDQKLEDEKPDLKRQAQEWANLKQDPKADLFVFVGRWSQQKGVDSIADVFPSVLETNPQVQLICIGPVIDLYGKFAALKLARMMEVYPGRVFSKPEFTALPPYIFSGADFALMPSRDEPFGLVAVEFGRKGALCVGARVGGLGQMPGWWFTIESTTSKHFIHQFKIAIQGALNSKPEVRAIIRARAAKQRFPVAQWVEDLEKLQSTAIEISQKQATKSRRPSLYSSSVSATPMATAPGTPMLPSRRTTPKATPRPSPRVSRHATPRQSRASSPVRQDSEVPPLPNGGLGSSEGPSQTAKRRRLQRRRVSAASSAAVSEADAGDTDDEDGAKTPRHKPRNPSQLRPLPFSEDGNERTDTLQSNWPFAAPTSRFPSSAATAINSPFEDPQTPLSEDWIPDSGQHFTKKQNHSALSLVEVKGEKTDYKLQNVSPFFTDPKKEFEELFERKLANLNGKTSEDQLCIEEYLVKSEKTWFGKLRDAELGRTPAHSPAPSVFHMDNEKTEYEGHPLGPLTPGEMTSGNATPRYVSPEPPRPFDEFLLGANYQPPTGLKHILRLKIGDWPLYSILLAFGQIIAANSYQITLLTGSVGQTASKLYVVASIYLASSIIWWFLYRRLETVYVLALPFAVYGLAFLFIGLAPLGPTILGRGWIQNLATGLYAAASSSGSVYFAVNFGDEGGAPVTAWTYRACVIQGTQQIYVVALWYWGTYLTKASSMSGSGSSAAATSNAVIIPLGVCLALLMWAIGAVLFIGLPKYYRQAPGNIPSFYTSLFRRKIIIWFFVVVCIQNYWLSAPYGRNWLYLWSSQHVPAWAIVVLVVVFFIGVWAAFLYIFANLSATHSWILPVFAIGLGAPRWAQLLWATSNIGAYVPWAGGPVASALAGRALWLWLGVLDAVQGVGFGMILLQTLTRFHVLFTLIAAQVLGSIATILARATAPNKIGPGDVFPDFSSDPSDGLRKAWFWVGLLFNLAVPVGFFMFFRKEQLSKP